MADRVEFNLTPVTTSERPPAAASGSQPADAAETATQNATTTESRPSWLPENFKSPEELAKSYAEQRAEITRVQQELAGLKKGEKATDPNAASAKEGNKDNQVADKKAEEVASALESKGLDVNAMSDRFWQTGTVAEEDLAALEKAGIPRSAILDYAELQQVRQTSQTQALVEHIGGTAQFEAVKAWAVQGVDPELASAYEAARSSGNVTLMKQALTSLNDAYVKENGLAPALVVHGGAPSGLVGGAYRSQDEMVRDMSDPRYRTDDAFRKDVANKIARSNIF